MPAARSRNDSIRLLRENLRLRGDLKTVATRISHDLRTPLGSISLTCERLKQQRTAEPFFEPLLGSMQEASRLLGRISFVLKASANPESKRPLHMGEAVASALQQLDHRIFLRKASITQPSEWPEIYGVRGWLEAVWWNLIANSLQHGRTAPRIELGWRKSPRAFRFWAEDNGGGVSREAREQLFQPFHTLHKLDSTRGLGLSIVQRLVELQGGTCGYQPVPGGASFYFTLPATL